MRIAWFSPLPPDRSGIAAYTAELAPLLASSFGAIDLYVRTNWPPPPASESTPGAADPVIAAQQYLAESAPDTPLVVRSAHEFVWRHRRTPYDLIVYQLGNSDAHDYMWAYLFRYPGLLVLHDAQVHQARALWLLRRLEPRLDDYLAELEANHPEAPAGVGYLFAAGLGGQLYHLWPLIGLLIGASRLTIVHNAHLAERLSREHPGALIRHVDMGVADLPAGSHPTPAALGGRAPAGEHVRRRLGIPTGACVVGAFGGMTPEKRIPVLLETVAASPRSELRVLLVGQRAGHYDVDADVRRLGLDGRVHVTGYVADAELPAYLAASDICWCLRWPSSGETSASWLRCLAAGKPTLITALAQLRDVPAFTVNAGRLETVSTGVDAVGIAIDPLDEGRDVACALDALASDPALRATLGEHARARWARRHTLPRMADAYRDAIALALTRVAPHPPLPSHLVDDGTATTRRILSEVGVPELPW